MSPSKDEPPDAPPSDRGRPAIGVETFVREESGQWVVDIAVAFPDGVVRRTVNTYRSRRHAEIAARGVRRAADREIDGPRLD